MALLLRRYLLVGRYWQRARGAGPEMRSDALAKTDHGFFDEMIESDRNCFKTRLV